MINMNFSPNQNAAIDEASREIGRAIGRDPDVIRLDLESVLRTISTDDIADRVIPLKQALETIKRISAAIEAL